MRPRRPLPVSRRNSSGVTGPFSISALTLLRPGLSSNKGENRLQARAPFGLDPPRCVPTRPHRRIPDPRAGCTGAMLAPSRGGGAPVYGRTHRAPCLLLKKFTRKRRVGTRRVLGPVSGPLGPARDPKPPERPPPSTPVPPAGKRPSAETRMTQGVATHFQHRVFPCSLPGGERGATRRYLQGRGTGNVR